MNLRAHGDAPISVQATILVGAGFALLVLHAVPDLQAWVRGEPPVIESCRAETARANERAEHYAAILTGCLNRGVITEDGVPVVQCKDAR